MTEENLTAEISNGIIWAFILEPGGAWREAEEHDVRDWTPGSATMWIHLDAQHPGVETFLKKNSQLDELSREALLEGETRPRTVVSGNGLLINLRGVNLNPGADPDDLVSIRLWTDGERVFSSRRRRIMAAEGIRQQILSGTGPASAVEIVTMLAAKLVERMSEEIENLDDRVDELENRMLEAESRQMRTELAEIRRSSIALRRYLAPQREALTRLHSEELDWLDRRHRAKIRETTDRVIRYVEDLDSVRERTAVIQDELMNRLSDQMNRNMYLLTIVATVMLPLGFLTGLLGINVDGIPGAVDTPWAFAAVCAGLTTLVAIEIWVFRRLGWLG